MLRPALLLTLACAAPAAADPVRDRIYPAPTAPLSVGKLPGARLVEVRSADGLTLRGIEAAGRADRPVVLLLHGNGSSAADALDWLRPLTARGYGVVAAEYRGYSANPGKPSEAGLAADADAFLAHARALAGGRRVVVLGHSLGGGVAFGLARRHRLDALVTVGTFTRLRAMAPRIARALIADRFDNLAAVPALDEPWFLVHGTADEVVPVRMGEELHRAAARAGKTGTSYVLPGQDHRPDGELVATLVDAVAARLEGGAAPAPPKGVNVVPFGG
jgi:hypothetical protein